MHRVHDGVIRSEIEAAASLDLPLYALFSVDSVGKGVRPIEETGSYTLDLFLTTTLVACVTLQPETMCVHPKLQKAQTPKYYECRARH